VSSGLQKVLRNAYLARYTKFHRFKLFYLEVYLSSLSGASYETLNLTVAKLDLAYPPAAVAADLR